MKRKALATVTFIIISLGLSAQFSVIVSNVRCYGACDGSAQIMPDSGYIYKWSNGDNRLSGTEPGLCAGTYYCTIFNRLGVALDTLQILVTQPAALSDAIAPVNTSCNGGSNGMVVIVAVGGTPPYNYSLTPDGINFTNSSTGVIQGLKAGGYDLAISDSNGCTITDSVTVGQPLPIIESATADSVSCYGASDGSILITAAGGTLPYSYFVRTILTLDTGYVVDNTGYCGNLPSGGYVIIVSDSNGCRATDTISVYQPNTSCTGIKDITPLLNFSMMPNPASDVMSVVYELNDPLSLHLTVYDMNGRKVMDVLNGLENTGPHTHLVNVKELATGNYLLSFMSDKGSFSSKFTKE